MEGSQPSKLTSAGRFGAWCASARQRMERLTFGSTPTTPIDSFWLGTSRHLVLPSVEGGHGFPLLTLGHLEVIKGAAEFRGDLVEHIGWDLQVEVGVAKLSGHVLKWSARHRGDPQCPQELEAR